MKIDGPANSADPFLQVTPQGSAQRLDPFTWMNRHTGTRTVRFRIVRIGRGFEPEACGRDVMEVWTLDFAKHSVQ